MRDAWYLSRFTGLFRAWGAAQRRAHDPAVAVWAGTPANRPVTGQVDGVGGAGWTDEAAQLAAVGEAIERWQTHRLPVDAVLRARMPDGAIDPAAWVLFDAAQYAQPGFPFVPLPDELDWVKFRRVADGEPAWVPAELAFMDLRPGAVHRFTPAISTGWSAHRSLGPAVLRGVQEVIERDALIGGWWGAYPIEHHPLPVPPALARPNLTYRAYRIASPYSDHVTMVTVEGDDREGPCFAIGSACRETRAASLEKAALEAVQGRHYVRYLLGEAAARGITALPTPRDFREHALGYSLDRARLATTPLATAQPAPSSNAPPSNPPSSTSPSQHAPSSSAASSNAPSSNAPSSSAPSSSAPSSHAPSSSAPSSSAPSSSAPSSNPPSAIAPSATALPLAGAGDGESLAHLVRRLGDAHPPLFRVMTPPALAQHGLDWVVVRVMIPGLQPMHGDHALPFLGGPCWGGRPLAAWADIPPHPFA